MGVFSHDASGLMSVVAETTLEPNLRVKWGATAGEVLVAGPAPKAHLDKHHPQCHEMFECERVTLI